MSRLWQWLTDWWYDEKRRGWHPDGFGGEQTLRCALLSLIDGGNVKGGTAMTAEGTDYWWHCQRCGVHDSSL